MLRPKQIPHGFISVEALCQEAASKPKGVPCLQSLLESRLPSDSCCHSESETEFSGSERKRRPVLRTAVAILEIVACQDQMLNALPCRVTSPGTPGLNSSFRSHRKSEARCSAAYAGLDKTLFEAVGPNSHGRGRRFSEAEPVAAEFAELRQGFVGNPAQAEAVDKSRWLSGQKPPASTARWQGLGWAVIHCSIRATHLAWHVNDWISLPPGPTETSVTVEL